jgi:hypothetical protein
MPEIFKIEHAPQAPQEPTPAIETPSDTLSGNETKVQDIAESNLEVWETENHRKFGEDYFKIREISHEFNIKMDFGNIDKYVKSELTRRNYENTTENYQKVLQEIESEIGSTNLDTFSRLKKLAGYANALRKLYQAKELKDNFRIASTSSQL